MSLRPAVRREGPLDQALLMIIVVLLGATFMLWLTGEVSGFVHSGEWPSVSLSDMGAVATGVPRHPLDPAARTKITATRPPIVSRRLMPYSFPKESHPFYAPAERSVQRSTLALPPLLLRAGLVRPAALYNATTVATSATSRITQLQYLSQLPAPTS